MLTRLNNPIFLVALPLHIPLHRPIQSHILSNIALIVDTYIFWYEQDI